MIYIWDNGGDYSDHEIYFIETSLPFEEIDASLLPGHEHGELLGKAERIEWLSSGPCSLEDAICVDDFFGFHWESVNPGVEESYPGGGPKHEKDRDDHDLTCWKAAKYKTDPPGRMNQRDPVEHRFQKLNSSVANELLSGWRKQESRGPWWPVLCDWFALECKERGLL